MKFKGKVIDVIYVNEETGYTVLTFDTDTDFFTAVGIFPIVTEGEWLELSGEFKPNQRFGEQFVVDEVIYARPDDREGIFKYLSGGLFKGVGEKTARLIVDYFGLRTLDVLEERPSELKKIPGIGDKKLYDIIESYKATRKMKDSILFLQKYGITMGLALKIYRRYEEATISVVSENPYILVEEVEGIGFITADKIANAMGIDKHSPFRIRAGIFYALSEAAGKGGHTCLPDNILTESASKILGVEVSEVYEVLNEAAGLRKITTPDGDMVSTELNYRVENAIATKLILLKKTVEKWDIDVEKSLADYEKSSVIELHENQSTAIKSVFKDGVTVITGGPGTGKTTIIKAIVGIASQRGKKTVLCAPTGRASKRMTEMTGAEAKTIHRLLGVSFGEQKFERNETNPLEADIVIVDEISMTDIYVFYALLKALPQGSRLVLVGDKDQLPSVSCGNVLGDVISSGEIKTVFLTEIYRQEGDSLIVTNAHRINRGEMPVTDNKTDFFITYKNNPSDIVNTVIGMLKTRIPNFTGLTSNDIQVLTPVKRGIVGVENLNLKIQEQLNPSDEEYLKNGFPYRKGDKVMQNVNDYELKWEKPDGESGTGVFNGEPGYVTKVTKDGVEVEFDDERKVFYGAASMEELIPAYCISVHKSQGCEFPVVILALSGANFMIMTRNLLYTAVTRAKKMVVIVGEEGCIKRMVSNDYTAKRYSLLKEFLLRNKSKVELLWGNSD